MHPVRRITPTRCTRARRQLLRILLAAVAAGIALSGCATADRAGKEPAVPKLSKSMLDLVLLSQPDINDIAGTSDLTAAEMTGELVDASKSFSDVDCVGAVFTAQETAYSGSGWTAVRKQTIKKDGDILTVIYQTAVLFDSADQAHDFLDASRNRWERCANTTVTSTGAGTTGNMTFRYDMGEVAASDGVITLDYQREFGRGRDCQHALGVVANLVAEAVACGQGFSGTAKTIVTQMLDNAVRLAGAT